MIENIPAFKEMSSLVIACLVHPLLCIIATSDNPDCRKSSKSTNQTLASELVVKIEAILNNNLKVASKIQ